MTHTPSQMPDECEQAFEDFLKRKSLSNEKTTDVWDRPIYKHAKIEAMYYAWRDCWERTRAASVPVQSIKEYPDTLPEDQRISQPETTGSSEVDRSERVFINSPSDKDRAEALADMDRGMSCISWCNKHSETIRARLSAPVTPSEALEQARHAIAYAAELGLGDEDYVEICPMQLKMWKSIKAVLEKK